MTATIVVLLGTDHHPFDRLVGWTDAAARRDPATRFVVQYGTSAPPGVAEGHEFLTHTEMVELLAGADGVVCHGGPGTIMDARDAGHVPVCVPRDPSRGEHVDGHQQRFAALVDGSGVATRVTTEDGFRRAIADLVGAAGATRRRNGSSTSYETELARERLAMELDELMVRGPRHVRRGRGARVPDTAS